MDLAGTLLIDVQPALETPVMSSFPNVAEQMASGTGNAFSQELTALSITSALDISHGIRRSSNYFETPLFSDQTTPGFPCSGTEYGSKAPAMYLDTAFGSKAPVMYPATTFGSVSAQYERLSQAITRTDMQQNDGVSPYEGSGRAPGADGYG